MKKGYFFLIVSIAILFTGCASVQTPIAYTPEAITRENSTIGIAITEIPKADTWEMGNIGLLDMAIISAATNDLTKHLQSLDLSEFNNINTALKIELEKAGYKTLVINDPVTMEKRAKTSKKENFSKYDFTDLKEQHQITHLLLIEPYAAGTIRSYYGFAPTSDPQAKFSAKGSLIDLETHALLWFQNEDQVLAINGEWDESDLDYPNLTNSLYQALNMAKENLEAPF